MKKSQLKQIIKEEISRILNEDSVGNYFANGEGPYLDNKNRKPLKNTDHAKHYVHHNSDVSTVSKLQEETDYNTVEKIIGGFFQHFFMGEHMGNINDIDFLHMYEAALKRELSATGGWIRNAEAGGKN